MRGFADQACSIAKAGIDELLSGDNPFSICITLTYGLPVFLWSGELQSAENYTNRLMEYAGRYSLEVYRAVGLGLKGAIAIARDELETGIDLLRGALETLTTQRMNILLTEFMGPLAEGLRKRGQPEEALLTINRAIERATDRGSTFDVAELLRIKAQILAVMPQYGRDQAMNCLTEALVVIDAPRRSSRLSKRNRQPERRAAAEPDQIRVNFCQLLGGDVVAGEAVGYRRRQRLDRAPQIAKLPQMDQPDIELHGKTSPIDDRDLVATGASPQHATRHQAKSQAGRDHAQLDLRAVGVDRDAQTAISLSHGAF
jgi:hypothetical protein